MAESSRGSPETCAKQLAFTCDVRHPDARRVSSGGTIAPASLYEPSADSPDPAEISVKSGPVKLVLVLLMPPETGPEHHRAASAAGILLVQMLTPNHAKVEFFPGRKGEEITDFTASAKVYER